MMMLKSMEQSDSYVIGFKVTFFFVIKYKLANEMKTTVL